MYGIVLNQEPPKTNASETGKQKTNQTHPLFFANFGLYFSFQALADTVGKPLSVVQDRVAQLQEVSEKQEHNFQLWYMGHMLTGRYFNDQAVAGGGERNIVLW